MPTPFYLAGNPLIAEDYFRLQESIFLKEKHVEKKVPSPAIEEVSTAELSEDLRDFVSKYLLPLKLNRTHLFNTRSIPDILNNSYTMGEAVVNFKQLNDYRNINKFLETVNERLAPGGLFINNMETHRVRKDRILKNVPAILRSLYYTFDFLYHRIVPKLKFVRSLYFKKTKGYGRVLTRAEAIGRLYACGFEIIDEKKIDGRLHFVAKKVKEPSFDRNPTYGPLIYLRRVGKGGKIIKVAKVRTMHPYAEYLQQYVFNKNNLKEGGKIKDDFRISRIGRVFRKYWIDELPMIINVLKRDLKLVGVRPISTHYFSLYPESLQRKRTQFKPGLLPPFYADMPKTLDDIIQSEMAYLNAYEKQPILTDFKYLLKILKNIVFGGNRSA